MKIAITFNLKRKSPSHGLPEDAFEEFDAPETIDAIAAVFRGKGHTVCLIEADSAFLEKIQKEKPDFVFNIAEGYEGRNRESYVPNILEFLSIPYSHSDGFTLATSLDKSLTKMIAKENGVRTPDSSVILSPKGEGSAFKTRSFTALRMTKFPLFLKPSSEGSSKGIRLSSLVNNEKEFESECSRLWKNYGSTPLLAEEYIRGREVTVGVLGTENPRVIGMMEIRWKKEREKKDFIYSLEVKRNWREWVEYEVPAPLNRAQSEEIETMALKIHRALECRDVSRIDFRIDEQGVPYFIEMNPLPGLSPDYSDLVIMIRQLGWTYDRLILSILEEATGRYKRKARRDMLPLL